MGAVRNQVFERSTRCARPLGLCAIAALAFACGSADGDSLQRSSGDGTAAPGSGQDVAPSADPGDYTGTNTGLVSDPPLLGGACTGQVAQDTFAAALCSCEDTNIAGYLRTRGLGDSDDDADLVGSVGV